MVKQNFKDNPKSSHKELSLSVVHILATCSSNLRKGLQQEFYQLNDRCEIRQKRCFYYRRIIWINSLAAASMYKLL